MVDRQQYKGPPDPADVEVKTVRIRVRSGVKLKCEWFVRVIHPDGKWGEERAGIFNDVHASFKDSICKHALNSGVARCARQLQMEDSSASWTKEGNATLIDGGDGTKNEFTKEITLQNDSGTGKTIDKLRYLDYLSNAWTTATLGSPVSLPSGSYLYITYKITFADDTTPGTYDGVMGTEFLKLLAKAVGQDASTANMDCGPVDGGWHRLYYTYGGTQYSDGIINCYYAGTTGPSETDDVKIWWDSAHQVAGHNPVTFQKILLLPYNGGVKNETYKVFEVTDTTSGVNLDAGITGRLGVGVGE